MQGSCRSHYVLLIVLGIFPMFFFFFCQNVDKDVATSLANILGTYSHLYSHLYSAKTVKYYFLLFHKYEGEMILLAL